MNIKERLKERLLEIPCQDSFFREKHKLSDNINANLEDVEVLLKELCEKGIIEEKIEYICKECRETTILNETLLKEITSESESGCFECDNCWNFVNPRNDKTGYIFYDIKDKQLLMSW